MESQYANLTQWNSGMSPYGAMGRQSDIQLLRNWAMVRRRVFRGLLSPEGRFPRHK